MGLYTIFSHNNQTVYKSKLFSKATIFITLLTIFATLTPIAIIYETGGIWKRHEIIFEHPHVIFTRQYLFIVETHSGNLLICSSLPFNISTMNSDECSLFSFSENDDDFDSFIDNYSLKFEMNLSPHAYINAITLILIFDVTVFARCKIQFQGLALWNQIVPPAPFQGGLFHSDTYLDIVQSRPVDCKHNGRKYGTNQTVIEADEKTLTMEDLREGFQISSLLKKYNQQQLRVNLRDITNTWLNGARNKFKSTFFIQMSDSQINFKTTFWYIIKWAWIQYICIAAIVFWIINQIKTYLFTKQILMAWCITNHKKKA